MNPCENRKIEGGGGRGGEGRGGRGGEGERDTTNRKDGATEPISNR